MNKEQAVELRTSIDTLLSAFAKKHGLSYDPNRTMHYSKTGMKMSFELVDISDNGIALTQEAQDFKVWAPLSGIDVDLGWEFDYKGIPYKITGWRRRSRKYPVIIEPVNDKTAKTFCIPADYLKLCISAQKAVA